MPGFFSWIKIWTLTGPFWHVTILCWKPCSCTSGCMYRVVHCPALRQISSSASSLLQPPMIALYLVTNYFVLVYHKFSDGTWYNLKNLGVWTLLKTSAAAVVSESSQQDGNNSQDPRLSRPTSSFNLSLDTWYTHTHTHTCSYSDTLKSWLLAIAFGELVSTVCWRVVFILWPHNLNTSTFVS